MISKKGSTNSNKGSKIESTLTTPSKASPRKPTKNAKITNFFAKVSSPANKNSDSNHISDQSENDSRIIDELDKDASSLSMKVPDTPEPVAKKKASELTEQQVYTIPSSDDDTNTSSKGAQSSRCQTSVYDLADDTEEDDSAVQEKPKPKHKLLTPKIPLKRKCRPKLKRVTPTRTTQDGIIGLKVRSPNNN